MQDRADPLILEGEVQALEKAFIALAGCLDPAQKYDLVQALVHLQPRPAVDRAANANSYERMLERLSLGVILGHDANSESRQ